MCKKLINVFALMMKGFFFLFLFVVHQSSLTLVKKHTLSECTITTTNPTTTILLTEAIKSIISLTILVIVNLQTRRRGGGRLDTDTSETLNLSLPAILYTIQNHVLYVGLKELETPIYLITCQLKILTTAIASVLILKKSYSTKQWISLMMLTAGVMIVQLDSSVQQRDLGSSKKGSYRGLSAMVLASLLSGLAAVWFERCLKKRGEEKTKKESRTRSLWEKNLNMSLWSLGISFLTILILPESRSHIRQFGFFSGYFSSSSHQTTCPPSNSLLGGSWFIVLYYSIGGLLVSLLVNQFDSLTKNFATCLSVIISRFIPSSSSSNPNLINFNHEELKKPRQFFIFYFGFFLVFFSIKSFYHFSPSSPSIDNKSDSNRIESKKKNN